MTTYIVDVNDAAHPTNTEDALQGAEELRAIKNKLNGVGSFLITWNPLDKSSDIALSSGNLIATKSLNNGIQNGVRTTFGKNTGKVYWEHKIQVMTGAISLGIGDITAGIGTTLGQDAAGYAYRSDGFKINANTPVAFGAAFVVGDTIGIAMDLINGTLQFYKNNVLQGTAYAAGLLARNLYPMASFTNVLDQIISTFEQSAFLYTPPTGFVGINNLSSGSSSSSSGGFFANEFFPIGI